MQLPGRFLQPGHGTGPAYALHTRPQFRFARGSTRLHAPPPPLPRVPVRPGLSASGLAWLPGPIPLALYLSGAGWLSGQALDDDFRIHPRTVFRPPWSALGALPLSAGLNALGDGPWALASLAIAACLLGARSRGPTVAAAPPSDRGDEARTLCATFMGLYFILPV